MLLLDPSSNSSCKNPLNNLRSRSYPFLHVKKLQQLLASKAKLILSIYRLIINFSEAYIIKLRVVLKGSREIKMEWNRKREMNLQVKRLMSKHRGSLCMEKKTHHHHLLWKQLKRERRLMAVKLNNRYKKMKYPLTKSKRTWHQRLQKKRR